MVKSKTTKYAALKKTLMGKIQSKEYPLDSLFPSQNMLMRQYKVSYATVSRVLRELQHEGIIERLRGKGSFVRKSNVLRNSSNSLTDFTIKVVVPQEFMLSDGGSIDIYQGLLTRASELGMKVENIPFGDDTQISETFFGSNDFFFMFNANGYEKRIIPELQRRNIPFLCHGAFQDIELGFNYIVANVRTPSRRVTTELIESGKKRIVFLCFDGGGTWVGPKLRGYQDAMLQCGLKEEYWEVPYAQDDIRSELEQYLESGIPDAIICATDTSAWAVLDLLRERNCKIPEDVAVVGFSNLPHSSDESVSLTSIEYPRHEIGRNAVDWMMHLNEYPEIAPASKVIEGKVFYRKSFPQA